MLPIPSAWEVIADTITRHPAPPSGHGQIGTPQASRRLHRHLRRRAERRHETLLVHPPQTQGCPVIPLPFLHPTAWDTQWWAVGVTRERLGVYVTKIQYTTRICNKPLRAGSPFYIHEVIQGVLSSLIHVLFHAVLSVLYGCVQ